MFRTGRFVCVALLGLPMTLSAREFTIPVFTPSDPSAPVTIRGTLTGNDDSPDTHEFLCSGHLTLTNISEKKILLIMTQARAMVRADGVIRSRLDRTDVDDYFFKSDLFLPKSTVVLDTKMFPQKQNPEASKWKSSRVLADVRIVFVQFADGSTWGNLKRARQYLEQRQQAWKELQLLATLYRANNEQGFVAALTESSALGPYLGKLAVIYSQTKAVEPVAREMENFLRLGNLHLRNMGDGMLQPASRNSNASCPQ
jgi:hypothetical protein